MVFSAPVKAAYLCVCQPNRPIMDISLGIPALIFPAISLLMLAYTNRFLAVASLIRSLHAQYQDDHDPKLVAQIGNLRRRVKLIRNMQAIGVLSLFLSVVSMFLVLEGQKAWGKYTFAASLIALMVSLGFSVTEIYLSTKALSIQLGDMEDNLPPELGERLAKRMKFRK